MTSYARVALLVLGAVLLLDVLGMIYLAAVDNAIPDVLELIAVGALTATAGILPGAGRTAP